MKTQFKFLLFAATFFAGTMAASGFQSDPAEEVPGDNFSLEGALELFKKSKSPQEFEQLLNSPDSKVNNLDLNGDGEIDYVRVTDRNDGNVHAFILSAVVSANESQDIAVVELEKRSDGTAVLQIVGDADVYGIETIIEPTDEVKVNAGASTARTVVNVWAWPSVQYVYGPYYNVWVSPWRWSYYPGWYQPWRPIAWGVYNPYWAPYRSYYSVCYRHRIGYAQMIYRPYRTTSVIVHNRSYAQISNFRNTSHGYRYDRSSDHQRNGRYDNSRSRTDNTTRNGRSTDRYRSSGRDGSSTQRSSDRSTRPARNFTPTQRSNSNDRSTSFHRNNSDNSAQRQSRQFNAPVQRQQVPAQHFQRSQSPSHSGGGSPGVNRMPQQQHRQASPSPSHGGSAGGGGGGHGRGRH